jgi:hypothetical protein
MYIFHPNLPQNSVNTVLIGEKHSYLSESLGNLGITAILVGKNCAVSPMIGDHPDISVFHAGGNHLIISETAVIDTNRLIQLGFHVQTANKPASPKYPDEVSLNACLVGNRLFHKVSLSDKNITAQAYKNKWRLINVNQGYTKCSICVLDQNHIITADMGIHKAAQQSGLNSLLISSGQIELDGYHAGFIGGACGKIAKDKIAFTGTLKYHKDENKINDYIRSLGIKSIYLTDEPCFDIGSIIPLTYCVN